MSVCGVSYSLLLHLIIVTHVLKGRNEQIHWSRVHLLRHSGSCHTSWALPTPRRPDLCMHRARRTSLFRPLSPSAKCAKPRLAGVNVHLFILASRIYEAPLSKIVCVSAHLGRTGQYFLHPPDASPAASPALPAASPFPSRYPNKGTERKEGPKPEDRPASSRGNPNHPKKKSPTTHKRARARAHPGAAAYFFSARRTEAIFRKSLRCLWRRIFRLRFFSTLLAHTSGRRRITPPVGGYCGWGGEGRNCQGQRKLEEPESARAASARLNRA